jgi:HlyD family secretion protein
VGQVISSASSSVSGGTTLLQMADLRSIRIRALVSESDIGGVRPGQAATVQVDAYPKRTFQGRVEKIEPQAVVQQSVTMFPVLVSITNEEGLLLPGMNGEVTVLIQERDQVLSVPLDAVRSIREIPAVAAAVGMSADSIRSRVRSQLQQLAESRTGGTGRGAAGGDSSSAGRRWRSRSESNDSQRRAGRARGDRAAGNGGAANGAASAGGGSLNRDRQTQFVFVKTARGLEPRVVRLGLSNFDYAEILGGVAEGDEVALLGVAELQAQRNQNINRMRQRMGSAMPGVGGGSSTGGAAGRRGGS